ncbi:MAG: hypothetical protein NTW96_12075 [Planctomycetia bacterium]|nr:hypothetical protein [Planctomycetia bacterium]
MRPWMTSCPCCLGWFVLLLAAPWALAAAPETGEPIRIGSRRELLVDDYLIDRKDDAVALQMHHPTPREMALVLDAPWEGNSSGYFTVLRDDRYRMYYRGHNFDLSKGTLADTHPEVTCYAESPDGIHWTKPELGLVEFGGSKKNNIIVTGPASHNFCPMLDANPNCKPDEKFKGLGGTGGGLFAYKSADGIHWSLLTEKPVVTEGAFDSQNLAFWDPNRGSYVEYHRAFRDGRDIMTSTSADFLQWTAPKWLAYTPGRITELYTNQVSPYYRAPHVYLGLPTRYVAGRGWYSPLNEYVSKADRRCGTDYTDTGFMTSRDSETFHVWPEALVRPGPVEDLWTYGFGYTAWGMVETKSDRDGAPNDLSLYVTDVGHWRGKGNSIRRYTLRLDGFVSATAPLAGGSFVTKPIVFDGKELRINFETSVAGSIQIAIQDADGKPIPGFTLADCPSLFGNSVDYPVRFNGKADLASLAGKPVRLQFVLKDADLYAFQFK